MKKATISQFLLIPPVRKTIGILDLLCPPFIVCYKPPVTNYVLLYSTLLCENNARAPGGHKTYIPTKLGGGGEQNRSEILIHSLAWTPDQRNTPLHSDPHSIGTGLGAVLKGWWACFQE